MTHASYAWRPWRLFAALAAIASILLLSLLPGRVAAYPGADNLSITEICTSPATVRLNIGWTTYNLGDQWIDISHTDPNFGAGTYTTYGPFPGTQSTVVWEGLESGLITYLRINTSVGGTWYPSATAAFFTNLDCGITFVPIPIPVPVPAPIPVPLPVPPGPPSPGPQPGMGGEDAGPGYE